MRVDGFDWDTANRGKCRKHGVTLQAIETVFAGPVVILPDAAHSQSEEKFRAIGRDRVGRFVFLVFTLRRREERTLIRPISARYMHAKEIAHYAKENPQL